MAAGAPPPAAYAGLGTWIDIYHPQAWATPSAIAAAIGRRGVRTLYVQTGNYRQSTDVVRASALGRLVDAAHAQGLAVVGWYLPSFRNPARDLRRALAAVRFRTQTGGRLDSFALDIESSAVRSPALRTARLVELSRRLRAAVGPSYALGAIIPSPRGMQLLPHYWPGFPYSELWRVYDVFLPMAYFSYRAHGAAAVARYVQRSVGIIRARTGDPDVPIHVIGGVSDRTGPAEARGFMRAIRSTQPLGFSLYDFFGTRPEAWRALSSQSRSTSSRGLADPHPCSPTLAGFTCSTLSVPLDHSGRRPGTLDLQVAAANNVDAPRGVLLFLTGGPGQPGVPFVDAAESWLGPALGDYRLVLYDQRGTGAGALRCPALQKAMGDSDLYPPSASAVRSCAATLGARRSLYGTDDVVADMELLRRALGVERWSIDGVSYGTFVGERYALAHPERVARLVLDSVVPHRASAFLANDAMRASARVLRLACRLPHCATDPARDLAAVVRKRHDGPRLLDALTLIGIVDPTYRTVFDVPGILRRARRGDTASLVEFLRTARRLERVPARGLSQGLHASTLCADWRFPWGDSAAPLAGRAARLAQAVRRLPARAIWPFDRKTASGNGLERQCLPWPPAEPTPQAPALLPDVPTLLLSGDRDLSTPLQWGRREAAVAPGGRLVVFRGASHAVQRTRAGANAVVRFLLR